ncbi:MULTISPECIES: hypothetical protein [unclassified Nocardioides]|jgi:hypothetical protein|uniref:hypothetical protein n=1 Tax=unclassified Nocardioides TaxID=2615069 RepID=UPI00114DF843|nr:MULTISPECIES: hypothetical protein [unclassified Nocardioides]TQK68740.1 hypothetical protein FBY23_0493 [Nocardioides sp. SLBN-35]WGY01991.1 hypothetical protein QI633_26085 [Nocardioides sp. QY071]
MRDLLTLVPIFAFMLIPLWIPLAAMAFGALHDVVAAPGRLARRTVAQPAHRAAISPVGPRVPAAGTAR